MSEYRTRRRHPVIVMHRSWTARTPHPSSSWTRFHEDEHRFTDKDAALTFLHSEYYHCKKRLPCYQDTQSRGTVQSGWIYCYKERDQGKTYYHQDWVSFYDVQYRVLDVSA
jgi:hypothetical protein